MSTLTITTIQTDLKWEDKAANLRCLEEKILSIPQPTELVVLPEMFSTGFTMRPETLAEPMDGPTFAWMRSLAARKRVLLTGSIIVEEEGRYFNRLIWMLPNGSFGYYDKRHRFAYAGEDEHYTAGHKRLVASVKGWKIMPLVCYDLRFPVWSRQTPQEAADAPASFPKSSNPPASSPESSNPRAGTSSGNPAPSPATLSPSPASAPTTAPSLEYDLLLYVANWPQRRSLAWKTLLQARAIENQSFVVGVNRVGNDGNNIYHSGDSMIIDPLGEILYQGEAKEDIFTLTLRKETLTEVRQRFPFWRDADHFSIEP